MGKDNPRKSVNPSKSYIHAKGFGTAFKVEGTLILNGVEVVVEDCGTVVDQTSGIVEMDDLTARKTPTD